MLFAHVQEAQEIVAQNNKGKLSTMVNTHLFLDTFPDKQRSQEEIAYRAMTFLTSMVY